MKRCFIGFTALSIAACSITAQHIPYFFTSASGEYQSLMNGILLTHDWAPWKPDGYFTLPIGFPFKVCEAAVDSFDLFAGSSLFFRSGQSSGDYGFAGFSKAITDLSWITPNAFESLSEISFEIAGVPGSHILKIQWSNAGFMTGFSSDFINFQIWLYEGSNAIEVHFGPQHITSSQVYEGADNTGPVIGILDNPNADAAYLFGAAQNPSFGYPPFGFKGLEGTPAEGTILIFTPLANDVPNVHSPPFAFSHYQMAHQFLLENAAGVERLSLINSLGNLIQDFYFDQSAPVKTVNYLSQPPGVYFAVIRSADHSGIFKKVFLNDY